MSFCPSEVQDGSRREVNLIPNAQIEDQLFNQLADKKVDVDAWLHPKPGGSVATGRFESFIHAFFQDSGFGHR